MVAVLMASLCLIVGVIIGLCAASLPRAFGRERRELPPPYAPTGESVYVFAGTVFPAPHDPRWRRVEARDGSGADVFVFGDRDIRLSSQSLIVGEWYVGGDGEQTKRYFLDVQRCFYAFRQLLALQTVEGAVLNAGFGKDEPVAVPPKCESPSFAEVAPVQAKIARVRGPSAREMTRYQEMAAAQMSPVFRVDDTHVLPHPSEDGWEWCADYDDGSPLQAVTIRGGGHRLIVWNDGDARVDGNTYVRSPKVAELYRLVAFRLPARLRLADRQAAGAMALLAATEKATR